VAGAQASRAVLRLPEFRAFLLAAVFSTLASRFLAVVIGFQVYQLTRDPLALGWLGLVEAIPAVSLALFGGYVADRGDRRLIVLITRAVSIACAITFALISFSAAGASVLTLYAVVLVAGIARGFAEPASGAFEAQVVPRQYVLQASALLGSVWQSGSIIGPALGGVSYAAFGAGNTYLIVAVFYAFSLFCIAAIPRKAAVPFRVGESIWTSIAEGVHYVFKRQILVGSMALDLFAVLFGGAMALLPVFATDILEVGAVGFGLMNAAPAVGALFVMISATRRPPAAHAGRNLLLCVAGFGVTMIVFALSRNFLLSLVALAFSGAFDGVSMVIRRSILRLLTPDRMRGRVFAVSSIFIGSSNEIGAFESGVAAKLLGVARSVWMGGIVTLLVVAGTAVFAPKLRALDLSHPPDDAALDPAA
jgi:MFS family permease